MCFIAFQISLSYLEYFPVLFKISTISEICQGKHDSQKIKQISQELFFSQDFSFFLIWEFFYCSPYYTLKKESEVTQLCPTLCDPMDYSLDRLLCPWDFPGKNTGVNCHSFLQGIFPPQGSNLGLPQRIFLIIILKNLWFQASSDFKTHLPW